MVLRAAVPLDAAVLTAAGPCDKVKQEGRLFLPCVPVLGMLCLICSVV
jgi:hypothetical protein